MQVEESRKTTHKTSFSTRTRPRVSHRKNNIAAACDRMKGKCSRLTLRFEVPTSEIHQEDVAEAGY